MQASAPSRSPTYPSLFNMTVSRWTFRADCTGATENEVTVLARGPPTATPGRLKLEPFSTRRGAGNGMLTSQRRLLAHSAVLGLSVRARCRSARGGQWVLPGLASSDVSSDYELGPAASGADDDRGFKGIVGFRPLDSFAIEANYVDLGETVVPLSLACVTTPLCPTEASIDSQAISVSAVGLFTLPLVDLFARVGYASWESELAPFATQDRSGSDPTYGAGAQVRLGSLPCASSTNDSSLRRRLRGPRVHRFHLHVLVSACGSFREARTRTARGRDSAAESRSDRRRHAAQAAAA